MSGEEVPVNTDREEMEKRIHERRDRIIARERAKYEPETTERYIFA